MTATEQFINTTAISYDMDVEIVRDIAKKSKNSVEFYSELKNYIKIRSNCNN